jgi:tetratricopeptide (TPR) repeat protein
MNRFIRELRRREVFRSAGLYVGVCWILIEASSVMVPTFGGPEWVLKAVIIGAFVGFPVMLVLAWVYDFSAKGIEVQGDATDTIVEPAFSRKMDFIVIGVLSVALIFSIYMNIVSGPEIVEEPDPVSILIADFDNQTGNGLFDGLLEQALNIGVESAPHVTSYERNGALALATRLQPSVQSLDTAAATLVAVREGIQIVLAGSIRPAGAGFEMQVDGHDPAASITVFEITGEAGSAEAVLQVVGDLSRDVREELGDTTLSSETSPVAETFTAASLEAAKAYTTAIQFAYEGKHDEAVREYETATQLDANFGRAYSGWALSEFKLGRTGRATELWDTALSLMETMTERERYRTLGLYYMSVTGNYASAVQSFGELVEKYPADAAGHNNLAVAAFMTLDFQKASEEARQLLEIYPNSELYRSNYALYAMYSGDFETAATVANELIVDNPGYGTSYLPLAISHIASGDYAAARAAYDAMARADSSHHRESLATLGLADLAMYSGAFSDARELLSGGIERDLASENAAMAAVKHIAVAQAYSASGEDGPAITEARKAIELSTQDTIKFAAARIFVGNGDAAGAEEVRNALTAKLQPQSRAYGLVIQAMIERQSGNPAAAVDLLREALVLADLWLIRFELGRTYLEAEFFAEALSEFTSCNDRRGEASAVFLDDMPSFRYFAELPYWTARAEQGIGMQSSSLQNFERFLALRPEGGPLADDARQRIE